MLTDELPLMESYLSIQGEGFHQGKPAYFIRLGGCDVGCVWCDTRDSWDATAFPVLKIEDIANRADQGRVNGDFHADIAVITGGEPLMYDLTHLTGAIHKKGLKTHLETSGAYPLTGTWDWVCFSPKKFKTPLSEFNSAANELKVIIYNESDLEWGEQHASKVNQDCRLFLQPEWGVEKKVVPMIKVYIEEHPKWQISYQLHKYLNIP